MRGLDDAEDGLNEAAFDRALGLKPKKKHGGKARRLADEERLTALKADWYAGRGEICAGTFSHSEQEPERDHFDVYLNRSGTLVAYRTTMALHQRYIATYGRPTGRWCYEVPAHITEVVQ